MCNILSLPKSVITRDKLFLPQIEFGLFAFGTENLRSFNEDSLEGSGPKREKIEADFKADEPKLETQVAFPSTLFLDDLIIPANAGNLEKKAFFVANSIGPANTILGYLFLNPDSKFVEDLNPSHLVHKPIEFPTQSYAAYGNLQDISAVYQDQQVYEQSGNAVAYQSRLQTETKPYSFPLLKPEDSFTPKFAYGQANFAPNFDMPKYAIEALNGSYWQTTSIFVGYHNHAHARLDERHGAKTLENLVAKPDIKFSHTIQPQQFLLQPLTPRSYKTGVDCVVKSFFAQIAPKYQIPVTNISGSQNQLYHQQTPNLSNIIMKASSTEPQHYTSEYYGHKNSEGQNPGQKNHQATGNNESKPTQNSQVSKNSNVIYLNNHRKPRRDNIPQDWQPKSKRHYKAANRRQNKGLDATRKGRYYLMSLTANGNSINMSQRNNEHQEQTLEQQNGHDAVGITHLPNINSVTPKRKEEENKVGIVNETKSQTKSSENQYNGPQNYQNPIVTAVDYGYSAMAKLASFGFSAAAKAISFFKKKVTTDSQATIDSVVALQVPKTLGSEFKNPISHFLSKKKAELGYGNMSFGIFDKVTNEYIGINDKVLLNASSLNKIAIAYVLALHVQKGLIDTSQKINYNASLDPNRELKDINPDFYSLFGLMLRESSNPATNILLGLLANGDVQKGVDIANTTISSKFPEIRIGMYTQDYYKLNKTTAEAQTKFIAYLSETADIAPEHSKKIMEALENERTTEVYAAKFPGKKFARKPGVAPHEVAMTGYLDDRYAFTVMFNDSPVPVYDKPTSKLDFKNKATPQGIASIRAFSELFSLMYSMLYQPNQKPA